VAVRPYVPADLEGVLELWRGAGGWYRATMPVTDAGVRTALSALRPGRFWPETRRVPAAGGWVAPDRGDPTGFLYARTESDVSYVAPLLRRTATGPAEIVELVRAAERWFGERDERRYLTEIPLERPELAAAWGRRARPIWRRQIYRLRAPLPPEGPAVPYVRPFQPRQRGLLQELARGRFPDGAPPPVPIPFLAVPARSPSPWAAPLLDTAIWVLFDGPAAIGVAGATCFPHGGASELGPLLLGSGADPPTAAALLRAPLAWLGRRGTTEVRASIPAGLEREAAALAEERFERIAEGEVVEVTLGDSS
jgi:hypothetical protein